MQTLKQLLILFLPIFLTALQSSAQKNPPTNPKSYPHLVMKTSYSTQLQVKEKEIEKKINVKTKLPATNKLSPAVLKSLTSAGDFFAAYQSVNAIVGPMFFPANHRTYLRIGEHRSGLPPIKDQVVSAFFNETEQSSLMADKDFAKSSIIKSQLSKDNVAAWHIETAGGAGFKISTTGTKKYLCVKRTSGVGTEQISLTTDPTDLTTNWTIFNSAENGITFYNRTYNVFLGRRTQGRKIFLLAFPFKDYGNEALRKVVLLSWDLYNSAPPTENACIDANYSHSLRYVLSRPQADADGDGHISTLCGGDDCDDNDASKYPGNAEFCDADGHDEDCNGTTSGFVDNDGDGYSSFSCFQLINGVVTSQGQDCDDNNRAIYPGQQRYIDEKTVEVCAVGIFEVESGFKAVRQPNGTAIVVPKTN